MAGYSKALVLYERAKGEEVYLPSLTSDVNSCSNEIVRLKGKKVTKWLRSQRGSSVKHRRDSFEPKAAIESKVRNRSKCRIGH